MAKSVTAPVIESIRAEEKRLGLHTLVPYEQFAERVFAHRDALKDTLLMLVALPAIIWAFLTQMWLGLGDTAVGTIKGLLREKLLNAKLDTEASARARCPG